MTETYLTIELNCETGEETTRPMTAEEITQLEADRAAAEERQAVREAEAAATAAAKASAETKLAALGLSADEIAALSK
jgi:hypothetical protein